MNFASLQDYMLYNLYYFYITYIRWYIFCIILDEFYLLLLVAEKGTSKHTIFPTLTQCYTILVALSTETSRRASLCSSIRCSKLRSSFKFQQQSSSSSSFINNHHHQLSSSSSSSIIILVIEYHHPRYWVLSSLSSRSIIIIEYHHLHYWDSSSS